MNTIDNEIYDITFIGSGPVTLYGLYYCGMRRAKTKVLETQPQVGGGLMALYPDKYIYDVAGFPKIYAKDLINKLHEQANQYDHKYCLNEKVIGLEKQPDGIIKLTTTKGEHLSKSVIICTGMGAFMPRKLDIPNVRELEGAGVYYFIKNADKFKDKDILVVGGGDAAFDYTLMLEPVAKSITMINRIDFFSAHEDSIEKVKASTVRMLYPFWEVKEIEGEEHVSHATIIQSQTGESERLKLDAIVFNIGFLANIGPIKEWGLELNKNSIAVDSRMRTNIEGVYAAGDTINYDGKLKLISTGFGEVAIAVNNAKNYVDPDSRVTPGHSTQKHGKVQKQIAEEKMNKKEEK